VERRRRVQGGEVGGKRVTHVGHTGADMGSGVWEVGGINQEREVEGVSVRAKSRCTQARYKQQTHRASHVHLTSIMHGSNGMHTRRHTHTYDTYTCTCRYTRTYTHT
jgi:hypothetical protein